jgi:hypothetical protein
MKKSKMVTTCDSCSSEIDNQNAVIYLPPQELSDVLTELRINGKLNEAKALIGECLEQFSSFCIKCWLHWFAGHILAQSLPYKEKLQEMDAAVDAAMEGISPRTYIKWMGDPRLN